jgi:hypothetical protein
MAEINIEATNVTKARIRSSICSNICHRLLSAAMPTPTNPPLAGYRIILKHPPRGDSAFSEAVAKKFAEAKDELWTANTLWELVYDQGHDLSKDDATKVS